MTIDVIIPAYNCAKTLGRTLASLAAQTDRDFRLTIVDDCSTEDINPVVYRYRGAINDIRVIRKSNNEGAGMARQTGIDKTDGEWITFVDADDVLMPYAIEVFKIIIENNPDMNVLHSAFLQQSVNDHEYLLMTRGYTWMHGKLYRRAFLEKYGIRNAPQFSLWADDSYFNSQCTELTPLTMNDLPMYVWTDTAGSLTRTDPSAGRKKMKVLIDAMIAAGEHTLKYKDSIGHLGNTLNNIDNVINHSDEPLTTEETESYNKLRDMYAQYGVPKPPDKKRRGLFRKYR